MNLLNVDRIREPISAPLREQLDSLEVFAEIGSTNSYLLDQLAPPAGRFRVVLAEHQTAGRGRMDRRWQSPPSSGLCMSMSYTFHETPQTLPCLTLAVGVGVAQALEGFGIRGIGLKWPNDIVLRDGKLGGILTEVRSLQSGSTTVVTGIGINVNLDGAHDANTMTSSIGHVSDLASSSTELPSRSAMSTSLIERLFDTFAEFEADGFGRFHEDWPRYDWLRGQQVSVEVPDGVVAGVCQGIDTDGALLLQSGPDRRRITSGSVRSYSRADGGR